MRRATDRLVEDLRTGNRWVRAAAVRELGQTRDVQAVTPLLHTLRAPSKEARAAAAEALGQIADPRAVPPLVEALDDRHAEVRRAAALALGQMGAIAAEAVAPLRERVSNETDAQVKAACEQAAQQIADATRAAAAEGESDAATPPEAAAE